MPFLGFVGHRSSSSPHREGNGSGIKESLRRATTKGPSTSTLSVQAGFFGHAEDFYSMDGKRHSIGGKLKPDRRGSGGSSKVQKYLPARLWLTVESPPLVSYNIPVNSSGALFSAQLHVDVAEPEVTFESVEVRFISVTTIKKPVSPHCSDCGSQTTELKKIELAKEQLKLKRGDHPIPVSFLFPGELPATTRGALISIEYFLIATAKTLNGDIIDLCQKGPSIGPEKKYLPLPQNRYEVKIMRSVLPGNDKHSIRIFPPTNLTASVNLNPVVHPIGEFEVNLRLSGMTMKKKDTVQRWRLRKMNWRIEETQKMVSPACTKHCEKLGGPGKGINHEDVRTIGEGEIDQRKNPWKNDLDAGDVESVFYAACNPAKRPVCDTEAPGGMSVTHALVVEMVVAEEWTPRNKPAQVTPTGAARILRTQFHLLLTERPGMGISWDEETPPIYEDVPESPPHYASMIAFDLNTQHGQIEEFHLDPNTNQMMSAAASSSGSTRSSRPESVNSELAAMQASAARARFVLTADDLLSSPPERAQESDDAPAYEEEDIQVESSNAYSRR